MADAVNPNRIGRAFERAALVRLADWLAAAVVAALPWSTSVSQILIVAWLVVLIPTLDVATVRRELQTAAGALPVMLWLLAVAGVLWANVPWAERIAGLGGFHKLLIIPLLLAQFRRSERGWLVLHGFLASCVALLLASVVIWLLPFHVMGRQSGVPVRDYIAQSTEFLICSLALLAVGFELARRRRFLHAAAAAVLALLFLANILMVSTGRTALAVLPLLVLLLGFRLSGWKGAIVACLAGAALAALAWTVSPFLRERINRSLIEVQLYQTTNELTSTGMRFEMWRKAAGFVSAAPAIGHGTGTIADQYRRAASGEGLGALAANNPHNQVIATAIQLGLLGTAVLVALWGAHLALFRGGGLIPWFGLVIVTQNVVSSLFNSHLFDSFHGWLYVFGFGVVGGMARRESARTERRAKNEAQ